MEPANEYGALFASYEGSGSLKLKEGGEVPCTFRAFQLRDGHVMLAGKIEPDVPGVYFGLNAAEAIVGTTTGGQHLSAARLFETNYLPEISQEQPGVYFAYRAQKLGIEFQSNGKTSRSRFAIVNVILVNGEQNIEHPGGWARLRQVAGCQGVAQRLQTLKGIDVTAELEVEAAEPQSRDLVADDICSLLSIARGTKVQWISRDDCTTSGDLVYRYHFSRVTKAYCPLPVIDPREIEDIPRFLAATIPTYVERRDAWGLARGLLHAYLDAKAEADYLQTRGIKLVVALEMLKEAFLQASGYSDLLRPQPQFRAMVPDLKEALKTVMLQHGLDNTERAIAYRNLQGLNRKPFEEIVAALCTEIQMNVPEQDRKLFVRCRNSLVHTGRFYCARADEVDRATVPPHPGPTEEYFWLLHFMDRLLLRLVGYQGPYIDWSRPGEPVRRTSL
jgi:hypothetical protein